MGVVDELLRARADFERGEWTAALQAWSGVEPDRLSADDLSALGVAAFLVGRREVAVETFQRAFRSCEGSGDLAGAIASAFHLSMLFGTGGEPALAAGWTARAQRLLEELGRDAVATGYVAFLRMHAYLAAADWPAAAACAAETVAAAGRHGDRDLLALGLCSQGRLRIYSGQVAAGLALLDEAMAGVTAGEVSAIVFGHVYCAAIEGCQEIADLGRVAEWTSALHRWCAAQPGLVAFTGQCAVHRGQVMRLRGAWVEALEELTLAVERYRRVGSMDAAGLAECERGDLLRLRGEYAAAEEAYQRSGEHGYDPQPGLALLWLARGSDRAASAAVRRLLDEPGAPVRRARLLPGAIDLLVATGQVDDARSAAVELDGVATDIATSALVAQAAYASAAVELAAGDPSGALPYLRKARRLWARVDSPYESARVRHLTGRALAALGDHESARQEWESARDAFLDRGCPAGSRGGGSAARPGHVARRADRTRGRGAAAGRLRAQQRPDRR